MLKTHKIFTPGFSSLLLVGLVAAANADSLTFTSTTIPLTDTGSFPQTLSLQEFNGSLGTLTGISLTFTGQFQGTVTAINNSGGTATLSSLHSSVPLTLVAPAGITLPVVATSVVPASSFPFTLANGSFQDFVGPVGSTSGTAHPLDFGDYTGTNSSILTLSVAAGDISASGSGSTTGPRPRLLSYSGSGDAGGFASVTYTFNPAVIASTPEPGTWAMLVAGASTGLIALRRRRNKK